MVQKTIGLLSSQQLEISSDGLSIDDFSFSLAEFEANQFFTYVKYQNPLSHTF